MTEFTPGQPTPRDLFRHYNRRRMIYRDKELFYLSKGREFPATEEGFAAMKADDAAYWEGQKIDRSSELGWKNPRKIKPDLK